MPRRIPCGLILTIYVGPDPTVTLVEDPVHELSRHRLVSISPGSPVNRFKLLLCYVLNKDMQEWNLICFHMVFICAKDLTER